MHFTLSEQDDDVFKDNTSGTKTATKRLLHFDHSHLILFKSHAHVRHVTMPQESQVSTQSHNFEFTRYNTFSIILSTLFFQTTSTLSQQDTKKHNVARMNVTYFLIWKYFQRFYKMFQMKFKIVMLFRIEMPTGRTRCVQKGWVPVSRSTVFVDVWNCKFHFFFWNCKFQFVIDMYKYDIFVTMHENKSKLKLSFSN